MKNGVEKKPSTIERLFYYTGINDEEVEFYGREANGSGRSRKDWGVFPGEPEDADLFGNDRAFEGPLQERRPFLGEETSRGHMP